MREWLVKAASGLVPVAMKAWTALTDAWWTAVGDLRSYRPELHYMRGPGPKWREKHVHRRDPVAR
ncbi:MAG TPA: hypothetical protein VH934_05720 [Xanthobacteraceae bacterium]